MLAGKPGWLAGWHRRSLLHPPAALLPRVHRPPALIPREGTTWAGCQREASTVRRYFWHLRYSSTPVPVCAPGSPGTNRTRPRGHTVTQPGTFEGWSYPQKHQRLQAALYPGVLVCWCAGHHWKERRGGAKPKELSGSSSGHKLLEWYCTVGGSAMTAKVTCPLPPEGATSVSVCTWYLSLPSSS